MPLALPIAETQLWLFYPLALVFFALVFRAMRRRQIETGSRSDPRSRLGIALQSIGICLVGLGPIKLVLSILSPPALAASLAVVLLMGGAIGLFASSATALGKNWSLEARMRSDHQLIRSGPYAHVRHPIYLGMLLFLLGLAVALGHWLQLVVALPVFLVGTRIRTKIEDGLLESQFGSEFEDYARSTPALIPKVRSVA